jgi:4-amino-4-deoxy-L-arabinose transferase-like glycosyltransferase
MPGRYPFRDLLLLLAAALVARVVAALIVEGAPYTDSAYYTLVAERLATGHGFSVPVLYSFLEVGGRMPSDPTLPVPSNGHWMPGASILSAGMMAAFGVGWRAGQVPMVLLATAWVGIAHFVAWEMWRSRGMAAAAAILAIFAGPLLILLPLVETFAPFGVLGALALWTSTRAVRARRWGWWLVAAGALVGLAALTRVDGVLLAVAPAAAWWIRRREIGLVRGVTVGASAAAAGLLVMVPWFLRNLAVFGAPMPSVGGHTLWITSYNEQFTIGSEVSLGTYLASGFDVVVGSKVLAAGELAARTLSVTGGILAVAFVAGLWIHRRRTDLRPFTAYWVVMFAAMTLLFTFHAPRGAFLHSASAWLPMALAIAVGSVAPLATSMGRWWPFLRRPATHRFLLVASVIGAVVLSVGSSLALLSQWRVANDRLATAARYLEGHAQTNDVVMFADPARLYLVSAHPGVAAPFDPFDVVGRVVDAYDVRWVVVTLEPGETRDALGLWDGSSAVDSEGESPQFLPSEPAFQADGVRVFRVTD